MKATKIKTPPRRGTREKPRRSGVFLHKQDVILLIGARADHFDLYAAVLGLTFFGLVVSHGLLLAFAFGVNTVFLNAFGNLISLDSF